MTTIAHVLRPNKGFPCNASLILVYRSPPNAPRSVEKILKIIFVNTATWLKSHFFEDQTIAFEVKIQHLDDQKPPS